MKTKRVWGARTEKEEQKENMNSHYYRLTLTRLALILPLDHRLRVYRWVTPSTTGSLAKREENTLGPGNARKKNKTT